MKGLVFVLSIVVLSSFVIAQGIGVVNQDYKRGEILVGFKDNVLQKDAIDLINSYKLTYDSSLWNNLRVMIVYVNSGTEKYWVNEFPNNKIVKYAELNYIASISVNSEELTELDIKNIEADFSKPEVSADHWSYGFKRFGEALTEFFTFNQEQKLNLRLRFLKDRLSEIKDLSDRDKNINLLIEDYSKQADDIKKDIENGIGKEVSLIKNTSETMEKHVIVLYLVYQKVPESAKPAILRAINKSIESEAIADITEDELSKKNATQDSLRDKLKERFDEKLEELRKEHAKNLNSRNKAK